MLTKCCDDFKHVSIETTTKLNQILNGCSPSITDSQCSEISQEIRHQCQIYTKIYREIVDYQKSFICIWFVRRYGNRKLVEASPVLHELNLITMNRKMSSRSQDSNTICSVLEIYSKYLAMYPLRFILLLMMIISNCGFSSTEFNSLNGRYLRVIWVITQRWISFIWFRLSYIYVIISLIII